MPSCVVKSCKNNSTTQKKKQGITFHRFPTDNEPWKRDWIEILRNSRGDNDWNPSSTSVVCSAHFDTADFYNTKMGRRRLNIFANPKKLLYETSKTKEKLDKPKTSDSSNDCTSTTRPVKAACPSKNGPVKTVEQILIEIAKLKKGNEPISSSLRDSSSTSGAVTETNHKLLLEISNIKQEQLDDPDSSSSLEDSPPGPVITYIQQVSFEPPLPNVKEESTHPTPSSPSSSDQSSSNDTDNECGVTDNVCRFHSRSITPSSKKAAIGFEHPSSFRQSTCPNPGMTEASVDPLKSTLRERDLLESLLKKQNIIIRQRDKIKQLNQKIRRLTSRNKIFKSKFKALRNNNHVT